MARRTRSAQNSPTGYTTVQDKQKALTILRELITGLEEVRATGKQGSLFSGWQHKVVVALSAIFGENSETHARFKDISYSPMVISSTMPDSYFNKVFLDGLTTAHEILEAATYQVETFFQDDHSRDSSIDGIGADVANLARRYDPGSKKVFLVHGHNETNLLQVARFLEKGGLEPIILHEQANRGKTIIEKFESNAVSVSFAIILLTADDVGGKNGDSLVSRARQNVVFEYGYFVGALGRDRVCALADADIEKPSDIQGVVYVSLGGDWKNGLVKELLAADVVFDLQTAFGG